MACSLGLEKEVVEFLRQHGREVVAKRTGLPMDELLGRIPLWAEERGQEEWRCGTPAGGLRSAIRKLPAVQVTTVYEGEYVLLRQEKNKDKEQVRRAAVKGSIGGEQAPPATQKHGQGSHVMSRPLAPKRKAGDSDIRFKAAKVTYAGKIPDSRKATYARWTHTAIRSTSWKRRKGQ